MIGVGRTTVHRSLEQTNRGSRPAGPEEDKGGTMTAMSSAIGESVVNDVARAAGLTQQQTHNFRNVAASSAMEGMPLTIEELRVGAEVAAGRIDFAEARRRLGV